MGGEDADVEALAPAGLFFADGFGEDAFEGRFRRAAVIFPDPTGELEDFRGDEGLGARSRF